MTSKLQSLINYALWAIKYSVINLLAIVAFWLLGRGRKYKDAWLIAELPGEARDNGYWLYEYIVNSHPEVNVYYAIKKDSPDYKKLSAKDRVIEYGSFQHYMAHVSCTRSISSHIYGASPGRYFCRLFLPLMVKKAEIFLQHGILTKAIHLRGYRGITIYTADIERELFAKSGHSSPDNLKQTGLARFDNLVSISGDSNVLLVMPTFRSYLHNLSHTVSESEFMSSAFYKHWHSLLNNPQFLDTINKHNLQVIFYPHRQMQVFNHLWNFKNGVIMGDSKVYDIQQLLMSSKIMITDYSSTYLDFMYMDKPAILYQFDKIEVSRKHYKDLGVYPLAPNFTTEDEVVAELNKVINNSYRLSQRETDETNKFYPYRDSGNRKRIFAVILEALK